LSKVPENRPKLMHDKDGNVVRDSHGYAVSAPPRSKVEAWALVVQHKHLADSFVEEYLHEGVRDGRTTYLWPFWFERNGWRYRDDLQSAAIEGLHGACIWWDAAKGRLSTLAAPFVGQALNREAERLLGRRLKERCHEHRTVNCERCRQRINPKPPISLGTPLRRRSWRSSRGCMPRRRSGTTTLSTL
jgi:hypothetical protein